MVDSALLWISLTTLLTGVGAAAFVRHYARTTEFDCTALATAFLSGTGGLELGTANGYLPESGLFNAVVGVGVGIAVVAGAVAIKRRERGFRTLRGDSR